jgi:1-acyl-sn-glycerol-3-phosphate acyltransferase
MYKPYSKPVNKAFPSVQVPESRISRIMVFLVKFIARLYLLFFLGIARAIVRGDKHLFSSFKRALSGESRCIIAFRHPNGGEAQLLLWFIIFRLRQVARKAGVSFALRPHAIFVYGFEVIRWGGVIARLVMPRLGTLPIHHTKMDSAGMARIYKAIIDGPYPLAIAPEGQVSYTTEDVPRLEQGTVRIGFHAAERLEKADKDCPVEVLPDSIHYRYGRWANVSMERLLRKIEKYTRLSRRDGDGRALPFTDRLLRARDYILSLNEKRYGLSPAEGLDFSGRVDLMMDAALKRAEGILGIAQKEGEIIERLYLIRQLCWDYIYLHGRATLEDTSPAERSLLDLKAGEAWFASRHMELVDFAWYFRVDAPSQDAPLHVRIEYVQNLWDFANRTMGGAYSERVINIHPKRVLIQVAPPLNLTERLPAYRQDRKGAIAAAMADLRDAYYDCIREAAKYTL